MTAGGAGRGVPGPRSVRSSVGGSVLLLVCVCGCICACGSPAHVRADDAPRTTSAPLAGELPSGAAPWSAPFTVRGRLDDPSALRWRIAPGAGPVDDATLRAGMLAAASGWNAEDGVDFGPAADDETPDLIVSWQTAADDPCGHFGHDRSVAHTGPMGRGTFVHLDASRPWCLEDRADGERLDVALAHELGHVLGLDHSPEPSSLMSSDTHVSAPTPADRAGLHSLYGGGQDAAGDVLIEGPRGGTRPTHALRRVAPSGHTAICLFDTDGDGDQEVLIWRTDREGIGALMIHHHASVRVGGEQEPRLVRTLGPWLDVVPPGARTALRTGPDGRRWIITVEGEDLRVRGFDERGRLRAPDVQERIALDVDALLAAPGPDVLSAEGAEVGHATDGSPAIELVGDLDGDGRPERLRRLGSTP
jgi:hypothetical protein